MPRSVNFLQQLADDISLSGSAGTICVLTTLALTITGIVMLFKRPRLHVRTGYTVCALLPLFTSFCGLGAMLTPSHFEDRISSVHGPLASQTHRH